MIKTIVYFLGFRDGIGDIVIVGEKKFTMVMIIVYG